MATPKHPRLVANQRKRAMSSADKRKKAYQMRLEGHRLDKIAQTLELDISTVSKMIRAGLEEVQEQNKELANKIKLLELERLDELQSVFFPKAMMGEVDSFYPLMKIMERRAKLTGLDAPEKQEIETTVKGYAGLDIDKMWPKVEEKI